MHERALLHGIQYFQRSNPTFVCYTRIVLMFLDAYYIHMSVISKNGKGMAGFVGRKSEREKLAILHRRRGAHLVVVKGRRRIGKSRLMLEFIKKKPSLSFTGLAPIEGVSAQSQRDFFARQLASQIQTPPMTFSDWSDAFSYLSHHLREEGCIVFFDEISWMGSKDPTFIPKLKAWWDTDLSQHPHALLVLCGSVSTWIEENILNSTAFFGRIALTISMQPLSLMSSADLLREISFKGSGYEVYKLLAVMGGIPWYLEQVEPSMMADENIKRLCFQKDGLLVGEFDRIFHDLFRGRSKVYWDILNCLKGGMKTLSEVRTSIEYGVSGTLSTLMTHLISCGFINKSSQWSIKTGRPGKQSLYRLNDPYIRFYLKYIEPLNTQIDDGAYGSVELSQIPGFDSRMGLQVEHLLLQNRDCLRKAVGVSGSDIVFDGPYRQSRTTRTKGCQVDYLLQTRSNNLFVCEFKFKRREIGTEVIDEVRERMDRLSIPRGFAKIPVLFHIGGVSNAVLDSRFFYRTIDITDFLYG